MKIIEYQKKLIHPLRPRTLCFLMNKDKVLLGFKKKGFGKGKWLGIGGKVEQNEAIEEAAVREVKEEINVVILTLQQIALLNFYFPHIQDESWNQQVHVFLVNKWNGEPKESEEIKPQWFQKNDLPIHEMWDDARYWLPKSLNNISLKGDFLFNSNLQVVDYKIQEKNI